MTRYIARLIKAGILTHLRLREILDGGKTENERRIILGCNLMGLSTSAGTDDLNRFRRQCRVECHLSTDSQRSSPQTLYIEKGLTLGFPLGVQYWNLSSSSSSSYTSTSSSSTSSSRATKEKLHWPPRSRMREGLGGSVDRASFFSKSPRLPSRSQSLPALELSITSFHKAPSAERAESAVQRPYTSTTVGAWVSNFSYDSGLADVGGATPSQSRDATGTPSEISISSSVSPVYRSTLYAHWWRKAKLPATVVLVRPSSPPFPSPTGKEMERSR